jgi:hypothetical protein
MTINTLIFMLSLFCAIIGIIYCVVGNNAKKQIPYCRLNFPLMDKLIYKKKRCEEYSNLYMTISFIFAFLYMILDILSRK